MSAGFRSSRSPSNIKCDIFPIADNFLGVISRTESQNISRGESSRWTINSFSPNSDACPLTRDTTRFQHNNNINKNITAVSTRGDNTFMATNYFMLSKSRGASKHPRVMCVFCVVIAFVSMHSIGGRTFCLCMHLFNIFTSTYSLSSSLSLPHSLQNQN